MPDIGIQIDVVEGQVTHHHGISFAGSRSVAAWRCRTGHSEIACGTKRERRVQVSLEEGNTFKIAGQTWRLDAIHDDGRGWYADLTRIA